MKRIPLAALCLALAACPALAEESVYYVNPDGGQRYHTEQQCPTMSSKYWDQLVTVTKAELAQSPYSDLTPCSYCVALPIKIDENAADPWIAQFDTATSIELTGPGVYVANVDIAQGLYTVRMTAETADSVVTAFDYGDVANTFVPDEGASYSFYLHDGMILTLPEHAILTPIAKVDETQAPPAEETIRHGRRMLYYEVPDGVYVAEAIDGQEGCIIFSSIRVDSGLDDPLVISLAPGETVTFDTVMDGFNDPMPKKYFSDPNSKAFFVEFVNCVVRPVE